MLIKKLILIILLLTLGVFGFLKLNNDFLLLWNANEVSVTTHNELTNDKVKIEFGISVNTINRSSDIDLFTNRNKYLLIYDGQNKNQIINDYGENDFLITYDNTHYLSFRHFKLNRRHQHIYDFELYKKDNNIFLKTNIKGENEIKFERKMLLIKNATKYVGNTPIDSIGCMYNMIDLKKNK